MPHIETDIITPRLILRLMDREVIYNCIDENLKIAEHLLGAVIPEEIINSISSLRYGLKQLENDPGYVIWSARAIILKSENKVIGIIRFHSSPDPDYLLKYATNIVEFGYRIFKEYRQLGYATEAVSSIMDWAIKKFGVLNFIVSVSPDNLPSLRLISKCGFLKIDEVMDETDGLEHVFISSQGAS